MKVIREKIPAPNTKRIYAQSETGKFLTEMKIQEETTELIHAKDRQERIEEAGDVIEALHTYLQAHDITMTEVLLTLDKKNQEKGRLVDRLGFLTVLR